MVSVKNLPRSLAVGLLTLRSLCRAAAFSLFQLAGRCCFHKPQVVVRR